MLSWKALVRGNPARAKFAAENNFAPHAYNECTQRFIKIETITSKIMLHIPWLFGPYFGNCEWSSIHCSVWVLWACSIMKRVWSIVGLGLESMQCNCYYSHTRVSFFGLSKQTHRHLWSNKWSWLNSNRWINTLINNYVQIHLKKTTTWVSLNHT